MSNINELKPIISLNPFARFCCTIGNLPSSYMASLTYEEQLLWFCDYLQNTVIPAVNNNAEVVKELQELYVKLKNYVDNYFNNLDVQTEINNKLDEMATDGTLSTIIQPYLNQITEEFEEFKSSVNTQIATQNNKIASINATEPIIVNSIEEMTENNKIYILSSNLHIYVGSNDTGKIYGSSSNNILGYNTALGKSNMQELFNNDFDNLIGNKIYTIISNSGNYQNAPSNDFIGTLLVYNYNENKPGGLIQLAIDTNNKMYFRICWGNIPVWSEWSIIDVKNFLKGFPHFLNETYWNDYDNDCNNLHGNNIYTITYNTNVLNLPKNNFIGTLISFVSNYNNIVSTIQIAIDNNNNMFHRINWGSIPVWTDWQQIPSYSQIENLQEQINSAITIPNLFSSFKHVGCIGDSLASGECSTSTGQLVDLYEISWGQFMAKYTNCTYYNFSKGGLTTKSWLTHEKGLPLATDGNHKCEAYIIGLGVNDFNQHLNVGSLSDINDSDFSLNADSFYGNYGKIIQNLKALYPKAKFFLLTSPLFMSNQNYNNAIREIANHFENCYLIDVYEDRAIFETGFIKNQQRNAHYNAIGYNYIAKYLLDKLNNYIYNNSEEFSRIEFINTDYD